MEGLQLLNSTGSRKGINMGTDKRFGTVSVTVEIIVRCHLAR